METAETHTSQSHQDVVADERHARHVTSHMVNRHITASVRTAARTGTNNYNLSLSVKGKLLSYKMKQILDLD
jgi:hypothetical protein